MIHDGFRYEFTLKELRYFLFGKKSCPGCGGEMLRSKGFETVSGRDVNSKSNPCFVPSARVKQYQYFYTCTQCARRYTLRELAK